MDEEELEQPSSKINVGSFFERVDSVDRVANRALSQSSSNLGIINNQKLIIQSLSVSIEAMETKIRDIANYIIIEKKAEKDAADDRLLEQEDKEQKQSMLERALKGDTGPKGDPGKPAEQQQQGGGGSFLGGLLKGLATLGISTFALKYIGPVLLPKLLLLAKTKLIPIIGTALKGGFVKLAALIGKVITGLVAKIPFVGKALAGSALFTGVGAAIIGIGNFISNALSGKGGGGGGAVTDSNVGMTDPTVETEMADTMKEKDLVKGKPIKNKRGRIIGYEKAEETEEVEGESFSEYRNRTGNVESEGESFSEYRNRTGNVESEEKEVTTELDSENIEEKPENDINSMENREKRARRQIEIYTEKLNNTSNSRMKNIYMRKINEAKEFLKEGQFSVESQFPQVEQYDIDIDPNKNIIDQVYEGMGFVEANKQDRDLSLLDDTNARVDRIVQSTTDAGNIDQNQGVIVPRNTSQTSESTIKLAKSDVKFVQLTANPYISISPTSKGLPPEVLRRLS